MTLRICSTLLACRPGAAMPSTHICSLQATPICVRPAFVAGGAGPGVGCKTLAAAKQREAARSSPPGAGACCPAAPADRPPLKPQSKPAISVILGRPETCIQPHDSGTGLVEAARGGQGLQRRHAAAAGLRAHAEQGGCAADYQASGAERWEPLQRPQIAIQPSLRPHYASCRRSRP